MSNIKKKIGLTHFKVFVGGRGAYNLTYSLAMSVWTLAADVWIGTSNIGHSYGHSYKANVWIGTPLKLLTSLIEIAEDFGLLFFFKAILLRECVWVFTFWTHSCFPLGWSVTFAFYKFLTLWRGTSIVLKMKVNYLKFLRWGFSNPTLSTHVYERTNVPVFSPQLPTLYPTPPKNCFKIFTLKILRFWKNLTGTGMRPNLGELG